MLNTEPSSSNSSPNQLSDWNIFGNPEPNWGILQSDAKTETNTVDPVELSQKAFEQAYYESGSGRDPDSDPAEARRVIDIYDEIQRMVERDKMEKGITNDHQAYEHAFSMLSTDARMALMLAEKYPGTGDPSRYSQKIRDVATAQERYNAAYNTSTGLANNPDISNDVPDKIEQPQPKKPKQPEQPGALSGDVIS